MPGQRIEIVRAIRKREKRALADLRLDRAACEPGPAGRLSTLQMGIGLTEWTIEWCEATERRLAIETEKE